jgi:hypothetical protein
VLRRATPLTGTRSRVRWRARDGSSTRCSRRTEVVEGDLTPNLMTYLIDGARRPRRDHDRPRVRRGMGPGGRGSRAGDGPDRRLRRDAVGVRRRACRSRPSASGGR